jgi:hypothetical protein
MGQRVFLSTIERIEEISRAIIENPEMSIKQLNQLTTDTRRPISPISCPRIFHNGLWRFPFKPPALLGVIDFDLSRIQMEW